jgi:hypothetical protein
MSIFQRKRRPPLVSIFGAGPAALFAAQAVYDLGGVVNIHARGERSQLFGAQYLHYPIPSLNCGKEESISYLLRGTVDGYRRKVYGAGWGDIPVSPETLAPIHRAWDIRAAYGEAWERFSGLITPTDISPNWLGEFDRRASVDLVVWTIPIEPLCIGGHGFATQSVWAQGDAPELGRYCSVTVAPWTVEVNGEDSPRWYRAANVFGHRTAEWPDGAKPPVEGIARVHKPVATNCNCWGKLGGAPVLRVGRYGTWTKGELSHESYLRTLVALKEM